MFSGLRIHWSKLKAESRQVENICQGQSVRMKKKVKIKNMGRNSLNNNNNGQDRIYYNRVQCLKKRGIF